MAEFLERVIERVHAQYGDQISDLCLILPNKRAGLFLKQHIGKRYLKALWAPDIFSIEEFTELISERVLIDQVGLLFEFYQVYREKEGKDAQIFEEFIRWAGILLEDFNEIDKNLVDARDLLGSINDTRAIEVWNPDGAEITETQERYLNFWASIKSYYHALSLQLEGKGLAYSGMAFRLVAENALNNLSAWEKKQEKTWKKILFIGFNAISQAEENIIRSLIKAGRAEVYWDTDTYYMNRKGHEAGKFLRHYHESWAPSPFNWISDELESQEKDMEIIGVAGNVLQAKLAGEIISQEGSGNPDELRQLAVILIDEGLLLPLLQSLPGQVDHFNVTMGYPLKQSPLQGLWTAILSLHENAGRLSQGRKEPVFYFRDLMKVLAHPFLLQLPGQPELSRHLNIFIRKGNRVFLRRKDLDLLIPDESQEAYQQVRPLFGNWQEDPQAALDGFKQLIERFRDHWMEQGDEVIAEKQVELEYLFLYSKVVGQLSNLLENYPAIQSIRTLRNFFQQVVSQQRLPFFGEPLRGVQIMGLLETRTLDFDKVIILSANEDLLPAGRKSSTFIPFDLRKAFHLPTYRDRDALSAYHFYRLIQRAKKVFMIYNTEADALGGGEKSRFIQQLQHELPAINPRVRIRERMVQLSVNKEEETLIVIPKENEVVSAIDRLMNRGLSPSALNTFVNCPLDFYYKYIAGIREPEEVEETIEATTMGDIIHGVLEDGYKPFEGKILDITSVKKLLRSAKQRIRDAFLRQFPPGEIDRGKNLLTLKISIRFVRLFYQKELELLEELKESNQHLTIVSLEEEFRQPVEVDGKTVSIIGKADRIDRIGSVYRIVDYKTGVVHASDLSIIELDDVLEPGSGNKALQLMLYGWLFMKSQTNFSGRIQSGIISMRKFRAGLMPVTLAREPELTQEVLEEFYQRIEQLIRDIYNSEEAFQHRKDAPYCKFCEN